MMTAAFPLRALQLLLLVFAPNSAAGEPRVWPKPTSATVTPAVPIRFANFTFVTPTDSSDGVLTKATARYRDIILALSSSPDAVVAALGTVYKVTVVVEDGQVPLAPGPEMNESYAIDANAAGCKITAHSVWGALHGLETFSQLVTTSGAESAGFELEGPVHIVDGPRFAWRGLM